MLKKSVLALFIVACGVTPALAHLDPAAHGSLAAGLSHPLFGLDHILAMVAVGLWAALLASRHRRALWPVPSAFVAMMAAGFAASVLGLKLPLVEPMILASVIVVGLAVLSALRIGIGAAMAIVGLFAFFHGHAHGGELGSAGAPVFALGFALSTALLHLSGIGLGAALRVGGDRGRLAARIAGGATVLGRILLAVGG